ncbi:hypothetical protein [Olleya aquimaris]|uniref:Lipoprotein n=1 Tax=Olleya aquimaris TaxID=639310 RepID=A0A327RF65_9FLAO|nr:hypothetical protein [Olleya aquimaris]RAJ14572.1 hypothetical protein LY08_01750 [Olleya aquimaris]
MKNLNVTSKTIVAIATLGLLFTSCSKDESADFNTQDENYSEVVMSSEIDRNIEVMEDIAIQVFEIQEASESSRTSTPNYMLPDCVTVTLVMEQNFRELTIDFGTEGCLVNNYVLKGKMILSYTRNPQAQEIFITKDLEEFYINNLNIVGSKTILRELSNVNGNPQFTKTLDITVNWPNGLQASRTGTKIREWIQGFGSGTFSDNVFEITGDWTTTFVNGNSHSYVVDIPLRREAGCGYFVSGSVDVVRTNFSGVFNYGEGTCDDQATFTFANGQVVTITLN